MPSPQFGVGPVGGGMMCWFEPPPLAPDPAPDEPDVPPVPTPSVPPLKSPLIGWFAEQPRNAPDKQSAVAIATANSSFMVRSPSARAEEGHAWTEGECVSGNRLTGTAVRNLVAL